MQRASSVCVSLWIFKVNKCVQLNEQQSEVCKLYDIYRSGMDMVRFFVVEYNGCARLFSCQIYGFDYHKNTRATSFILGYRVVDYLPSLRIDYLFMWLFRYSSYYYYCCCCYYYKHAWMNMRLGDLATALFLILLLCLYSMSFLLLWPTKAAYFSYGRFYSHSQQMVYACVRVFNV